jgi:ectoine hydroxylase-related dioxygenase (phytanoyl-CoA dioxygenase family)
VEPRAPSPSYAVERGVVPRELIDDALRLLHLDVLRKGLPGEELGKWVWAMHWFPHLNYDPKIIALADALPQEWRTGKQADPQILLQFPNDGPEPEISFHTDKEPDWAEDRRYLRIVGVPLSPWTAANGGLIVKPEDEALPVELQPGDAVMMSPDLPHSGGVNRTGEIRYGVYFRWLEEPGAS